MKQDYVSGLRTVVALAALLGTISHIPVAQSSWQK